MKLADITLLLAKNGSCIRLKNITPAEAVLLRSMHQPRLSRDPLSDIKIVGDVARSVEAEIARLKARYKGKVVSTVFPGASPTLPADFGNEVKVIETPKVSAPVTK